MAQEIERKYLVISDCWKSKVHKSDFYKQGYMTSNKNCSIRIRVSGDKANLNIKSATLGITRDEYDYLIPLDEANEMLDKLCAKPLIEKTRHFIEESDGLVWEIDVFTGDNDGLIVAEIELEDKEQNINLPDWVGEEVSNDPRYYNVCLIENPYKDW